MLCNCEVKPLSGRQLNQLEQVTAGRAAAGRDHRRNRQPTILGLSRKVVHQREFPIKSMIEVHRTSPPRKFCDGLLRGFRGNVHWTISRPYHHGTGFPAIVSCSKLCARPVNVPDFGVL